MKNLPGKKLEKELFKRGYKYVIGMDEVGMGCLAGPVAVCAVLVGKEFYTKSHSELAGLKESKLLSHAQREKFYAVLIKMKDVKYAIVLAHPKKIDALNIYQAARGAMRSAVAKLVPRTKGKVMVLVDGKHLVQGIKHDQRAIVKGDRKIFAIACASIIAKVHRDRLMVKLAARYPGYGFENHKGYGTKKHQAGLAKLGPCAIHRRSFAPVAKLATI